MTEHYASGNWHVSEGKEEQFLGLWREWLEWTRDNREGFRAARLIREESDPRHFISFAEWNSLDLRAAWKNDPGFAERQTACRALCDEFYGSDYTVAVEI